VGRNPKPAASADQVVSADLADLDQTIKAVAGSDVAYVLAGLKYDWRVWREVWPRIMSNVIEACKRANAKVIFFDNVYAYGKVVGPMTERTPFRPNHKIASAFRGGANSTWRPTDPESTGISGEAIRSLDPECNQWIR
jgi:nucleoside-diphosphate-sugar epimerase